MAARRGGLLDHAPLLRLLAAVGAVVGSAILIAACTSSAHRPVRPIASEAPTSNQSAAAGGLLRAPYHAARAGELPAAGEPVIDGVKLPEGHPQFAYDDDEKPIGTKPVMWVSDQVQHPAGDIVARLQSMFPETGLWPVVLQADQTAPDDGRPWVTHELGKPEPVPSDSVAKNFAELWRQSQSETGTADIYDTYGRAFPGLARTSGGPSESVVLSTTTKLPGRIGLVPTTDPADVPSLIGWYGATNYYGPGEVSFVLRAWQDRFGAELVRMGFDYIEVAVRKPAKNFKEALRVVAEQYAVCPDQVVQGDYDTAAEYARSLIGATAWYCWWD